MSDHELDLKDVDLSTEQRAALFRDLLAAVGGDTAALGTEGEDLDDVSKDMSRHRPHRPCAVVRPATPEQVAAAVRVCSEMGVPMVPRGTGTGVEGGAIPYGGGVVISTERLRKLELVESEMLAVVGAGIVKEELNKFLRPHGLLFGPDPSSNPSLGGMASTGASGMTTLRYGTTKENIVSLLVVTPSGDLFETRRPVRKSSSGYELTQLYMGSEGTLGIICQLTVRVRKQPPFRSGGYLPFDTVSQAANAVVAAVRADPPSMLRCELLNGEGVECTNAIFKTDLSCKPTLFLEMVGADADQLQHDFEAVSKLAVQNGASEAEIHFASDGAKLDEVWEARRGCYLAAMRYRGFKGGEKVYMSDVCVPRSKIAECVSGAEEDCKAQGLKCVICAHIADGNFHCLIPYQPSEAASLRKCEVSIVTRAIACGGTVTGEHGVGIGKVGHSCREHGEIHVAVQQAVKKALDPHCLLNPGKVLPLPAAKAKL